MPPNTSAPARSAIQMARPDGVPRFLNQSTTGLMAKATMSEISNGMTTSFTCTSAYPARR